MSTFSLKQLARSRRAQIVAGLSMCVVVGAIIGVAFSTHDESVVAYNNVSRNYRVCLMNDAGDTADVHSTQATWAGLQKAAATGRVNAERLPLTAANASSAAPYFNGAIQQHCGLIVAVGTEWATVVDSVAAANPHEQFLMVGGNTIRQNVRTVPSESPASLTSDTYSLVMSMAGG